MPASRCASASATCTRDALYLGVDAGTTGTKAAVLDASGAVHGRGYAGCRLRSPSPGRFLQDAGEWQASVVGAVRSACTGVEAARITAVAVAAQGGTLVAVDARNTPLGPARSWLDRRATGSAATFERVFGYDDFYRRTGWPIGPNNTAAQLLDLAHTEPEQFEAADRFCDTAAFLNGWLVGAPTIDANVAGITQLMNLQSQHWDDDILAVIDVAPSRLPAIVRPGTAIGRLTAATASQLGLPPGVVVGAGAHDQYCAALGAGAVDNGDVLLSTGTAWVMLAVATEPYPDSRGAMGSGRHFVPGLWGHFGEVTNGGVSVEWARRVLTHGRHEPLKLSEMDAILARTRAGADGISFFPFFDGTSPYDALDTSRGSLLGLSLSHGHTEVLRAVAEGVAFSTRILSDTYNESMHRSPSVPVVVGGAVRSREWMQILAGVLGTDLRVSVEADAACVGAAILAATAVRDVPSTRVGAQQMGTSTVTVTTGDHLSRVYDDLFATYTRDARFLSDLYASR